MLATLLHLAPPNCRGAWRLAALTTRVPVRAGGPVQERDLRKPESVWRARGSVLANSLALAARRRDRLHWVRLEGCYTTTRLALALTRHLCASPGTRISRVRLGCGTSSMSRRAASTKGTPLGRPTSDGRRRTLQVGARASQRPLKVASPPRQWPSVTACGRARWRSPCSRTSLAAVLGGSEVLQAVEGDRGVVGDACRCSSGVRHGQRLRQDHPRRNPVAQGKARLAVLASAQRHCPRPGRGVGHC